ncbi:SDR family NAD(P)-dependent oxidoreductase [Paraliomyxa miuraensis]|uniref:SDR family NAD(P)-dependent oxidoreductase n=1 Tax=Paraliomyxa miuraensis TaxID=376150 RepID=UPI00225460DC|nr:SDR family NAD(P)-dependent oxidoreductase [Paraliomyxa miuraensis]MCX4246186.1 SDR family NAD(P)-dependent oxidoreductase [Paraliomyxa miuraensis]
MERVLILGATSAIASEIAARYARRGARLYLVGRDPAKLTALCDRLGSTVVGHARADLDDAAGSAALVHTALEVLDGLDVAVIAHGLLGHQITTEHDWNAAEQVLRTNLLSPVSLLIPLANALQAQGHGHLAVLSSVAGERGRPRNYTYGAAKGALTIYLQGLRSRLWRQGIAVSTFKLGPVDTPMTADHAKNPLFATPQAVARDIVAHIDRGQGGAAHLPWYWAPIMSAVRHMPESIFQRLGFLSGR